MTLSSLSLPPNGGRQLGRRPPFFRVWQNPSVEITWYGGTCIRLRGKEGVIAADAYPSIVGPTGRGLTADIVTYSHPDPNPLPVRGKAKKAPTDDVVRPTSLEPAFQLDRPGEYEVHDVLVNGIRTYRDDEKGADRGANVCRRPVVSAITFSIIWVMSRRPNSCTTRLASSCGFSR